MEKSLNQIQKWLKEKVKNDETQVWRMEMVVKKKTEKKVEPNKMQPAASTISDEKYDVILADILKKHRKSLEILAKH